MAHTDTAMADNSGGTLLDDYLIDDDLARELNVTTRTLRNWRALGKAPPHIKVGLWNYTHRDHAKAWLCQRHEEAV